MIRQMCTKDKIVQALYQHTISWSDVPSDDDILELDDWKAYEKMEARAKEAYKNHLTAHKVYTIPQRTKKKKHAQIATRTPYITLKQRLEAHTKESVAKEPVTKESVAKETDTKESVAKEPVTKESVAKETDTKEIVEEIVHQSPIEYEELDIVHSSELPPVILAPTLAPIIVPAKIVPAKIIPAKIVPAKIVSAKIVPAKIVTAKIVPAKMNMISFPSFYQCVILTLITILIYYVNKNK
jgi:hypothetical protein